VDPNQEWYVGPLGIGLPLALLVSARLWRMNGVRRLWQAGVPVLLAGLFTVGQYDGSKVVTFTCVPFTAATTILFVVMSVLAVPPTKEELIGVARQRLRFRRVFRRTRNDLLLGHKHA